jgi:raffinose/stachyose/melibiose transport system substrate-binding protein
MVISACSSNSASDSTETQDSSETATQTEEKPEATDKPVTLSLIWFKNDVDTQMKELVAEFQKEHPNITINVESIGDGKSEEVVKSRFAAGKGPDIFTVAGPAGIDQYKESLADLTNEPWVSRATPYLVEEMSKDGVVYGMPYLIEGMGLVYNKKVFADAGITQLPTNFTELKAVVEQLKAKGITPFASGAKEWWILGFHMANAPFSQQSDPYKFLADLNSKSTTFKENPIFGDFKNFVDLVIENGEPNPLTTDWNTLVQMVSSGQVAMGHGGTFIENFVTEIGGDINNLGLLPLSLNDNAETAGKISTGMPFAWVVNKDNGTEAESKLFLDYMVSSETGKKYLTEVFKYIPAYPDIPFNAGGGVMKDAARFSSEGKTLPWINGLWPSGIRQNFGDHLQAYVGKKMTWDQVMDQFTADWNSFTQ